MTRVVLPHVLESIHKIDLLSTQHLIVRGSKKQQRRGVGLFKFHKRRKFFSLIKNYVLFGVISPCITLSCSFQKRPSSFLHCGQVENIHGRHGTYLKKTFWFALVPYPYMESRKRMINILLIIYRCMYVRPFLRPKNLYYVQNTHPFIQHIFHNLLINSSKLRNWNI